MPTILQRAGRRFERTSARHPRARSRYRGGRRRSAVLVPGRPAPEAGLEVRRTLCWRELDSNFQFRARETAACASSFAYLAETPPVPPKGAPLQAGPKVRIQLPPAKSSANFRFLYHQRELAICRRSQEYGPCTVAGRAFMLAFRQNQPKNTSPDKPPRPQWRGPLRRALEQGSAARRSWPFR